MTGSGRGPTASTASRGPFLTSETLVRKRRRPCARGAAGQPTGFTALGQDIENESGTQTAQEPERSQEPAEVSAANARQERLECLLTLRRLYRALAEARSALSRGPLPSSLPSKPADEFASVDPTMGAAAAAASSDPLLPSGTSSTWEEWLAALREQVLFLESLQSSAVKVEALVSSLEGRLATVFGSSEAEAAEAAVRAVADTTFERVAARVGEHVKALPYDSVEEARSELESVLRSAQSSQDAATLAAGNLTAWGLERVGPEVRRAEETIEKGLDQLRKRPVSSLGQVAASTRGLWQRLNGVSPSRGGIPPEIFDAEPPPDPVEAVRASKRQQSERVADISLEVESLEKELNEASKQREGTLRKQNALDRAKSQEELAGMDARVNSARRALAVRALQREMARIYTALEEEAADASEGGSFREEELALLVAEFCQLDRSLAEVQQLVDEKRESEVDDQQLAQLATDIPDLKGRTGVSSQQEGTLELSWEMGVRRVRSFAEESLGKARDAAAFLLRGIKLLGADISSSAHLFWRALRGSSLNRREVTSIRRTSRDLLTFVPFIAILVTPLTPVGHVLVFSFLQRYFPGLFPSQFTDKRQQLMRKYEELREQLRQAEEVAERNAQERAYRRAAEAVEGMFASSWSPFNGWAEGRQHKESGNTSSAEAEAFEMVGEQQQQQGMSFGSAAHQVEEKQHQQHEQKQQRSTSEDEEDEAKVDRLRREAERAAAQVISSAEESDDEEDNDGGIESDKSANGVFSQPSPRQTTGKGKTSTKSGIEDGAR